MRTEKKKIRKEKKKHQICGKEYILNTVCHLYQAKFLCASIIVLHGFIQNEEYMLEQPEFMTVHI